MLQLQSPFVWILHVWLAILWVYLFYCLDSIYMDQYQRIILTPFNFFKWKAEMEILLRVKGLYRVMIENEAEPNATANKIKWNNRRDEAYGIFCLSISRELLFHLDALTSPNEVWEKLEDNFWNKDEMRGHQLKNALISLSPNNSESLQL